MKRFFSFSASVVLAILVIALISGCDTMSALVSDDSDVKDRIRENCILENCGGINNDVAGKGAGNASDVLVLAHLVGERSDGGLVYSFEIRWNGYMTAYGMYSPESSSSPEIFEEGFNRNGSFSEFLRTVTLDTNTLDWVVASFTVADIHNGFVTFSFYGNAGRLEAVLPSTEMQYRVTYSEFIAYGEIGGGDFHVSANFRVNPNEFSFSAILPYDTVAEVFDLRADEGIVLEGRLLSSGNQVGSLDQYHTRYLEQIFGVGVSSRSFNELLLYGRKSVDGVLAPTFTQVVLCQHIVAVTPRGVTTLIFVPGVCKG